MIQKEDVEDLIYKIENEGDLGYVAQNWPELFVAINLGELRQEASDALYKLEKEIAHLAKIFEVDF